MAGIVRGSNGAVETNGVLGGVMGERGESSLMIYLSLLGLFRLMWGRGCEAQCWMQRILTTNRVVYDMM